MMKLFIFTLILCIQGTSQACDADFRKLFKASIQKQITACARTTKPDGYFVLKQPSEFVADLEFYPLNKESISTTPLLVESRIGNRFLKINGNNFYLYEDVNNDGIKDFVFRVSFEFGALLMAVHVTPQIPSDRAKPSIKFVEFFPTENTSRKPNKSLTHSEHYGVSVQKGQIKAVAENTNLGKISTENLVYKLNEKNIFYLQQRNSR